MSAKPIAKETKMDRDDEQKIWRTFEEFEREELRRDSYFDTVDDVLDGMFAGELDFEPDPRRRPSRNDHDDEE